MPTNRSITRRTAVAAGAASTLFFLPSRMSSAAPSLALNVVNTRGNATLTMQNLVRRKGFLEKHSVDVHDTFVVDGSRILGSLLSGENDVCILSGITSALTAIQKGARIKLIAGALMKPEHAVYTKRDEIRSLKDLSGKTIGTGSIGSLLQEMMVALFQKYKMDYASVRFVNVGSASDVFKAVVAGTVDAGVSEIDVYNQQAKYGVHTIAEGDLWKELPDFTFQATYASERAIAEKRDGLVRLLAAYGDMYRFLMTPQSEPDYVAAQADAIGAGTRDAAAWQWKFFRDAKIYATDLAIPPASVAYMQNLNVLLGMQSKALPYDAVVDTSLSQAAVKLLG